MRLIVDQSLATGFISIHTRQQKVSFLFKPGVLERKVCNSDDITFFSVLSLSLPSPSVIMCCSPHRFVVRTPTHYHSRAWQTLIHRKSVFYHLIVTSNPRKLNQCIIPKTCLNNVNLGILIIFVFFLISEASLDKHFLII